MTESVSFKVYLKRELLEVEVRRFGIDSGAATNFFYLQGKIQSVFPSIKNDQFSLFWQDAELDYVSMSSDEELMEALMACPLRPFKLYIKLENQQQAQAPDDGPVHAGITCDGCNCAVKGRRYKCVTCADYDLCSTCEAAGRHSEHFLLRIFSPMGPMHPKFMRKMFGRPHKFFKHGMCEFRRSPLERERERLRDSRGPAGMTDMFDFSALMEFINNLGLSMAAGQREGGQPDGAEQQASASASAPQQAGATPQQGSVTPQQENAAPQQGSAPLQQGSVPPQQGSATPQQGSATPQQTDATQQQATDYLSHLGQAITDFLDPFEVPTVVENSKIKPKKCRKAMKKLKKERVSSERPINSVVGSTNVVKMNCGCLVKKSKKVKKIDKTILECIEYHSKHVNVRGLIPHQLGFRSKHGHRVRPIYHDLMTKARPDSIVVLSDSDDSTDFVYFVD